MYHAWKDCLYATSPPSIKLQEEKCSSQVASPCSSPNHSLTYSLSCTKTGYRNNQVSNDINEETSHFSEVYMQKGESSSIKSSNSSSNIEKENKQLDTKKHMKRFSSFSLLHKITRIIQ
jgi:hypothetical protein